MHMFRLKKKIYIHRERKKKRKIKSITHSKFTYNFVYQYVWELQKH